MGLGSRPKYGKSHSFFPRRLTNSLRRTKLSNDPNNTAWSRSNTGYGQRIMLSQGWIPGSILGAATAPYANGNPEASHSYLRVTRRDDKCGLGTSRKGEYDDTYCTGLDVFQGILGRLNGRTEDECETVKIANEKSKTVNYLESRWHVLKFVSGGLLEGDRSKEAVKQPKQTPSSLAAQVMTKVEFLVDHKVEARIHHAGSSNVRESRKSKKQKPEHDPIDDPDLSAAYRLDSTKPHTSNSPESQELQDKVIAPPADSADPKSLDIGNPISAVAQLKPRKKRKRVLQNSRNEAQPQRSSSEKGLSTTVASGEEGRTTPAVIAPLASRHAVRGRYIRQKRMMTMDTKALNEVCYQFIVLGV